MSTSLAVHKGPLIERCKNAWQSDPRYVTPSASPSDSHWPGPFVCAARKACAYLKPPKLQRMAFVLTVAILLTLVCWQNYPSAYIARNKAAWDLFKAGLKETSQVYGSNKRVTLGGMVHISSLNPDYLPYTSKAGSSKINKDRRLIFVGDIHGCMEELQALLAKLKYQPTQDHIIALGDFINKGPDSKGVVDFLMRQNASCVRGNHEDKILLLAEHLARPGKHSEHEQIHNPKPTETKADKKHRGERELAMSLSPRQLEWLKKCPVILRVGDIDRLGQVVAVHAGLVPGVPLIDQDPYSVMNMRLIDLKSHVPSQKHSQPGAVPWIDFWDVYQKAGRLQRIFSGWWTSSSSVKHTTVVYGHDSRKGLQIRSYTKGLDSGCVNGKQLTAWVLTKHGQEKIVQVSCADVKRQT